MTSQASRFNQNRTRKKPFLEDVDGAGGAPFSFVLPVSLGVYQDQGHISSFSICHSPLLTLPGSHDWTLVTRQRPCAKQDRATLCGRCGSAPPPPRTAQALLASFGLYPCHTSGRSAVGGLRSVHSAPATHGHHTLPCARCISPTDTLCWDTGQMLHFQPLSPSVSPHAEFSLFAFQSRL